MHGLGRACQLTLAPFHFGQCFHGAEPLDDAFGEIPPLDTQAEHHSVAHAITIRSAIADAAAAAAGEFPLLIIPGNRPVARALIESGRMWRRGLTTAPDE